MNKTDLFQEKIRHSGRHLRLYFSEYQGNFFSPLEMLIGPVQTPPPPPPHPAGDDGDVDAAAHFITALFTSCSRSPDRPVYHHYTTATDTASVRLVFHMVMDQIVQDNLASVQLL